MGSDFSLGKFANAAPELLLLVSEGEIHGALDTVLLADNFFAGRKCMPALNFYGGLQVEPALAYLYHAGAEKI